MLTPDMVPFLGASSGPQSIAKVYIYKTQTEGVVYHSFCPGKEWGGGGGEENCINYLLFS